jgi:hypothetical protein
VLFEHLIYSTAIAIIAGMLWYRYTGRDPSWIIIASAFAPDLDIFGGYIFKEFDIAVLINGIPLKHGDFHNTVVLFIYAGVVGLILKTIGMKFKDSFIFAGIGFGAHIFEDMMVYNPGYAFLWHLSAHFFGIGIFEYEPNWSGIANTEVFIAGVITLIVCGTIRLMYEGNGGLKRIIQTFAIAGVFMVMIIPAIGFYDNNAKNFRAENIVDNWRFTQNALWDSTVSHNGSHSARIEIAGNVSKISGQWISNQIPAKPETNYTFSSWGKIEGAGGNNSPAVRVVELDANGKSIIQTSLVFGKGTHDWMQKQTIFKTRSNTTRIYVYGNIWKGYGTFWFDDVELYEGGTYLNIIKNNGFEIGIKHIINIRI